MIHGLAAQSGGALRLSSELGRGTSVELWLPQSEMATVYQLPSTAEDAPFPTSDAQSYAVLVVDDDILVSTGTAAMLEDLGHTVVEAYSGDQALEVLSSDRRIDIVLTDHAMPGMTGTELARRIKQRYPHIEVILASGFAELPAGEDQGLELRRLSKPFGQDELATLISDIAPSRLDASFPQLGLHKAI
jgi:CheY-like chemotaxis protein